MFYKCKHWTNICGLISLHFTKVMDFEVIIKTEDTDSDYIIDDATFDHHIEQPIINDIIQKKKQNQYEPNEESTKGHIKIISSNQNKIMVVQSNKRKNNDLGVLGIKAEPTSTLKSYVELLPITEEKSDHKSKSYIFNEKNHQYLDDSNSTNTVFMDNKNDIKFINYQEEEINRHGENNCINDLISANTVFHVKSELSKLTTVDDPNDGNDVFFEIKKENFGGEEECVVSEIIEGCSYEIVDDTIAELNNAVKIIKNEEDCSEIIEELSNGTILDITLEESINPQEKKQQTLLCVECSYTCSAYSMMDRHMKRHTGEKPYTCPHCKYKASTQNSLNKHLMIHEGTKPYKCNNCDYKCRFQSVLNKHMKSCGILLLNCNSCNYQTTIKDELKNHKKVHITKKVSICYLCSKEFNDVQKLKIHFINDHTDTDGYFRCPICSFRTAKKPLLRSHFKIHTKDQIFHCSECDYSTAYRSSLVTHSVVHTGDKPFSCDQCSYKSSLKSTLMMHKRKHVNSKHYACMFCSYVSNYPSVIRRHSLNKHTKEVGLTEYSSLTKNKLYLKIEKNCQDVA